MPFDVYSKRGKPLPDVFVYDAFSERLRRQLSYIVADTLGKLYFNNSHNQPKWFFDEIKGAIVREHGLPYLDRTHGDDVVGEIKQCLLNLTDIAILTDLIEYWIASLRRLQRGKFPLQPVGSVVQYSGLLFEEAVNEVNHRFRENGVGYEIDVNSSHLIRVDNKLVHAAVIQPALLLLSKPDYSVPNTEFLASLDEYKKGNYAESITKAGSAYESVMKVILAKKGWTHDPTKAASHLVKAIVDNAPLDGGYNQVLLSVANIRNLASSAHGGGTTPRVAEEHHCQLTLNLAASAMLYLVDEFG